MEKKAVQRYTVVGVFDDFQQAEAAVQALAVARFPHERVQLHPKRDEYGITSSGFGGGKEDMRSGIRGLFYPMFSDAAMKGPESIYAESIRQGCYVLTVTAHTDDEVERSANIMRRHHAVNIDERIKGWKREAGKHHDKATPRPDTEAQQGDRTANDGAQPRRPISGAEPGVTADERQKIVEQSSQGGVRVYQHNDDDPTSG